MAHDRTGWIRGGTGEVTLQRPGKAPKSYKNLTEFKRPCASCGENFSIFVTRKIADGGADSNSFGLRNCEKHRRVPLRAAGPELEELRMANRTMKEELAALYKRDQEHFAEVQQLKAQLAKYELQPAMMEFARGAVVRDLAFDVDVAPALTFPWGKN